MRIDSHHHQWDLTVRDQAWAAGIAVLQRSFLGPDLHPLLREARIDAAVLVQSLPEQEETAWLLARAEHDRDIAGVVGWVDLTAPDVAERLAELRAGPGGERLVGLRHLVQGEADRNWLGRPDVRRGLRAVAAAGLAFDLLVTAEQLSSAVAVVPALPDLTFILDHAGNPPVLDADAAAAWRDDVGRLAKLPNVAVKLSGLITRFAPAAWSIARLRPWARTLFDAFGPDRIMFGSDWPVCLMSASYADVVDVAQRLTDELDHADQARIFGGTAVEWYGLAVTASGRPSITDVTAGLGPAAR